MSFLNILLSFEKFMFKHFLKFHHFSTIKFDFTRFTTVSSTLLNFIPTHTSLWSSSEHWKEMVPDLQNFLSDWYEGHGLQLPWNSCSQACELSPEIHPHTLKLMKVSFFQLHQSIFCRCDHFRSWQEIWLDFSATCTCVFWHRHLPRVLQAFFTLAWNSWSVWTVWKPLLRAGFRRHLGQCCKTLRPRPSEGRDQRCKEDKLKLYRS